MDCQAHLARLSVMMKQSTLATILLLEALAGPATAQTLSTSAGPMRIEPMLEGLEQPWGVAFLPDGDVLVTERDGRLLLGSAGKPVVIGGVPSVWADGQGGLLDVLVPRDFATSREVWLAFSVGQGNRAATAMGVGRLTEDRRHLDSFRTLWVGDLASGGRHFGARLVEGVDGTIYLATGDRGTGPSGQQSQDGANSIGSLLAFGRDGTPKPPAKPGWAPGTLSIGHRNIQGAALDGQGQLWAHEHGARGGDEINPIMPGLNYGWPVISYGVNYNGARIGIGTEAPGLEQPAHVWDPSIAPSGLAIYQGDLIPAWRGNFLVGSLNSDMIIRLDPANGFAEERMQSPETERVRDIREGPDGAIWFLSVGKGTLYRMAPAQ